MARALSLTFAAALLTFEHVQATLGSAQVSPLSRGQREPEKHIMKRFVGIAVAAVVASALSAPRVVRAQVSFEVPCIHDGVMLADNKTFVVSVAAQATLIY